MSDLRPCPFCGGVAKMNAPDYEYYSPYWCKCTRCGAEGPTKSSELEAETGWNERAAVQVVRCSECKYDPRNNSSPEELPYWFPCKNGMRDQNWFCGYGERRNDNA